MGIRRSVPLGDPRLKTANKFVTDFKDKKIIKVVTDLIDTTSKQELIGMAAPQIGENYQIFVTEPRKTAARTGDQVDELRVYINPNITDYSKETNLIYEGCGSVVKAEIFGPVIRPRKITIEAFDQNGKKFKLTTDGILGRVIQHEVDHLNGIEFVEKVSDYTKLLSFKEYVKQVKNTGLQSRASIISIKQVN